VERVIESVEGVSWELALLAGALLVAMGPTVITPIFDHHHPARMRNVPLLVAMGPTVITPIFDHHHTARMRNVPVNSTVKKRYNDSNRCFLRFHKSIREYGKFTVNCGNKD